MKPGGTEDSCAVCGGLVYGGEVGNRRGHTIYAGSLDDPSLFKPSIGIFTCDKPDWVVVPPGLLLFGEHGVLAP